MENDFKISGEEKRAIVNYLSGGFSTSDANLLNAWLNKSEQNRLLFDQLSDIWKSSFLIKNANDFDADKAWIELQKQLIQNNKQFKITGWKRILTIAAAFILSVLIGGLGYYFINKIRKKKYLKINMSNLYHHWVRVLLCSWPTEVKFG